MSWSSDARSTPVGRVATYLEERRELARNSSHDHRRVLVDARFTYRPVFDDKLVPMTTGSRDHADLQNWSAGLTVGYQL
jgi:hypothetical protein